MPDWSKVLVGVGAAATGVALGYAAERAAFRRRLDPPRTGPEIGTLAGVSSEVRGPDGTRLFVETYGPDDPSAPQVVLVHGFSMTGRSWHEQVHALRGRARLVTYDQPGHGRSSPPRSGTYSLDLLGDALRDVIEQHTDPSRGRLVVAGHSMGGMTALACARRHPRFFAERVGGLLLLSTSAKASAEDVALGLGIQAFARFQAGIERASGLLGSRVRHLAHVYRASSDLSFAIAREVAFARSADPRYVDFAEQLVLDTDLETLSRLTPVLLTMDEDETLAELDVTTIVVVGEDDRITPVGHAEHIARVNRDVELVVLPGIGHMTPLEAHETVNALLVRLLDTALASHAGVA